MYSYTLKISLSIAKAELDHVSLITFIKIKTFDWRLYNLWLLYIDLCDQSYRAAVLQIKALYKSSSCFKSIYVSGNPYFPYLSSLFIKKKKKEVLRDSIILLWYPSVLISFLFKNLALATDKLLLDTHLLTYPIYLALSQRRAQIATLTKLSKESRNIIRWCS